MYLSALYFYIVIVFIFILRIQFYLSINKGQLYSGQGKNQRYAEQYASDGEYNVFVLIKDATKNITCIT